jgi:hypothetical protein
MKTAQRKEIKELLKQVREYVRVNHGFEVTDEMFYGAMDSPFVVATVIAVINDKEQKDGTETDC